MTATPPSPTPSGPEVEALVLMDSVRNGFSTLKPIIAAQALAAVVLFAAVRSGVPAPKLWVWVAYHVAMLVASIVGFKLIDLNRMNAHNAHRYGHWLTGFAFLRSFSWAIAAALFFPHLDFAGQTIFLALMCALTIGAATTAIAYFSSFVAFVVGALIPLALLFIAQSETRSKALGVGLLLGWLLILQAGRRLNRWLTDASARKLVLERTTSELQRKQAEADAAHRESELLREAAEKSSHDKTRFLAAASHDLRQPMHSLALYLEAARERNQDPMVDGLLQKVDQSVKSLDALFESLLDVSRLDSAVVTPKRIRFAIAPLLQAIEARFAAAAKEKHIVLRVRTSAHWALSDPALLERIVSNLVSNAVRYTHAGGVLVGVRSEGTRLRIEVWDTGVGIPHEKLEDVFKEFVQLNNPERDRRKGLGLGLAIVDRLSKLLDHPVTVRSRPRAGTVFTVSVPCVRAPASTPAPTETIRRSPLRFLSPPSVLLVDDEVDTLEATMTALEFMGCDVFPAANTADALATFHRMMGTAPAPHVVISDFRLGTDDGNGLELIERLRQQSKTRVPAVLLTGDAALFDAFGQRRDVPADVQLLSKPASSAQLTAAIQRMLPSE
jgi:two-component system, sensor histidine kinase